jgi:hypothetical protein
MMGTRNNPGKHDCMHKIAPDEPFFVLRANDPIAPAVVRMWAAQYWQSGGDPEKVAEARRCAEAMEAWHREHLAKEKTGE